MIVTVNDDLKWITIKYETELEMDQLQVSFKRKIRQWKFRTKNKRWKGDVMFIKNRNQLPIGLWRELQLVCQRFKFELKVIGIDKIIDRSITLENVTKFCESLLKNHPTYKSYDYQNDAVYKALKYKFCMLDLSTSAGKTLIGFLAMMYLFYTKRIKKILIVCPDTDLVIQMYNDFLDYANGRFNMSMCMIHGQSRITDVSEHKIVIGNFQSLSNRDPLFFEDFDCCFVDETHRATSESIKYIFNSCNQLKYRIGMSGSIVVDKSADYYDLLAYVGPIVKQIKKKELMEKGYATNIEIKVFRLNYLSERYRKELCSLKYKKDYDGEKAFRVEQRLVRASVVRLIWLCEMISKLNGNAIIFFVDKKTGYGKRIVEQLRRITTDKEIYYIDGDVKKDMRQVFKKKMEEGSNKFLVASYDTYSTGKSIKNIRYLVGAEDRKSEVIISQVMGRGMRLHNDKDKFVWLDIADDFSIDEENYENRNILLKHMDNRLRYYDKEGFDYQIIDIDLIEKAAFDKDVHL